jgi:hypothetical protein
MMQYPKSRPGVTEPALVKHLRGLRLQFVRETRQRPGLSYHRARTDGRATATMCCSRLWRAARSLYLTSSTNNNRAWPLIFMATV